MILLFKILCIYFMKNVIGVYSINSRNMHYVVRAISPPGIALESPQWSTEENVLYYVDDTGQKIHRYDPYAHELTTKEFDLGFVAFVIPVKGFPGKIIAGIETGVYFIDWYAKGNDSALSLLTVVDVGMPMNSFDDAKIDANGNLWAGTFARPPQLSANQNSDRATLYMINQYNFRNPEIKLRPVTVSNGITWSLDNKKMYYNDSPTRVVAAFDFDLKSGILANRTDFFKFDDYNITGVPDGMTKDSDGNIWVATASGASILKIEGKTGKLLKQISLPVRYVTSLMWGDEDFRTLYVTTGKQQDPDDPRNSPTDPSMPLSGTLLRITNLGSRGVPEHLFVFPDADRYQKP